MSEPIAMRDDRSDRGRYGREAVGDDVEFQMIEVPRTIVGGVREIEMGRRMKPYRPAWYEEPVTPWSLDRLAEVKQGSSFPIAAGERLYMLEEFSRLAAIRACDIVQMDLAHCGGLSMGKKIAALMQPQDIRLAPHCSIGPVALCAAIHFGWSTPQVLVQENFGDFDVAWRRDFVHGCRICASDGQYQLPDQTRSGH